MVTRAQRDDQVLVRRIDTGLEHATWQECREDRSRLGTINVKLAAVEGIPLYDYKGKLHGRANAVVADEYDLQGNRLRDEDGNVRPRFYYITTLPKKKRAYAIRKLYLQRWVAETRASESSRFAGTRMSWRERHSPPITQGLPSSSSCTMPNAFYA